MLLVANVLQKVSTAAFIVQTIGYVSLQNACVRNKGYLIIVVVIIIIHLVWSNAVN